MQDTGRNSNKDSNMDNDMNNNANNNVNAQRRNADGDCLSQWICQ